jgi:hypothetical protein
MMCLQDEDLSNLFQPWHWTRPQQIAPWVRSHHLSAAAHVVICNCTVMLPRCALRLCTSSHQAELNRSLTSAAVCRHIKTPGVNDRAHGSAWGLYQQAWANIAGYATSSSRSVASSNSWCRHTVQSLQMLSPQTLQQSHDDMQVQHKMRTRTRLMLHLLAKEQIAVSKRRQRLQCSSWNTLVRNSSNARVCACKFFTGAELF